MQSILAALRQAFFETDQGQFQPRWRLIGLLAVALILVFISAYLWIDSTKPPAGGAYLGTVVYLKCTNPDCGYEAHLTVQQIQQVVQGSVSWRALVITCPKCGQETLAQANQ